MSRSRGIFVPVEWDEWNGDGHAGQVEEDAPADAGPEPVEGIDDLLAERVDGGVEAQADGMTLTDRGLGPAE